MCQLAPLVRLFVAVTLPQSHVQRVQDEPCLLRHGGGPADDPAGEGVHDEGDVDHFRPGADVSEVGDPAAVGGRRDEVAVQRVRCPLDAAVRDRGDDLLPADGTGDAQLAHQAFDGAPGHEVTLAVQLTPDLPGPVDTVVDLEDLLDERLQLRITDGAGRRGLEALVVGVVGGRGDLAVVLGEHAADRLDTAEEGPVLVDERYERVCGRSSSAAKKLAAAFKMSLARFSSAISFFIALICADSSVVVPGRCPESTSSRFTQFRRVSAEPVPRFWATALKAADSFG
jgi:hypothetical protein